MGSVDLVRVQRRMRLRYEWGRLRRAVLGFVPIFALVGLAALLGTRPKSTLLLGVFLFAVGVTLLWYGRDVRRAVLPGVCAGSVPLALALGANRLGHVCTGSGCTSLCVPACVAGGLTAGLLVAAVGSRGRHGPGYWAGASSVALLTGAMGCACVGYSGLAGLSLGFLVGIVLASLRRVSRPASG